jgi:hypothetical protein
MSVPLTGAQLAEIVCRRAGDGPAAERCCAALGARPLLPLEGQEVPTSELQQIYKRRLSREDGPEDVVGSDRLLSDLDRTGEDQAPLRIERHRRHCHPLDPQQPSP